MCNRNEGNFWIFEVDFSFVESGSIDNSVEDIDIDLYKLIEKMRVEDFTDRSDYNSLVEELDISSGAQNDKDKNKIRAIITELEDAGFDFSRNSSAYEYWVFYINILFLFSWIRPELGGWWMVGDQRGFFLRWRAICFVFFWYGHTIIG